MVMMGSKVKVIDGSNCWKMKEVKEGKSIIQSLLLEIVISWKYVDIREKRKDVGHVTFHLNESARNDYIFENS